MGVASRASSMNLVSYVGKKVHITLVFEEFYYVGTVTSADDNSITLVDKTGKMVTLKEDAIQTIREVLTDGTKN